MRRVVFNMHDERPAWAPPSWVTERLRAALPADCELVEVGAAVSGRGDGGGVSAEAVAAIRGAEIYFGLGLPRELLDAALAPPTRLRWIHTGAAGVASLLHPEIQANDVILTNSAGVHAPPIAETVLGMILHFARGLDYAARSQQRASWDTTAFEGADGGIREIDGAILGIVGYGGIGRALAGRASALGMRVQATRRRASASVADEAGSGVAGGSVSGSDVAGAGGVQVMTGTEGLNELLAAADFVVLSVPSTASTRRMIGSAELARMRTGAVLINVARGDIVDEAALIDALRNRRIRGAGLDVFTTEPLPPDSALWTLDNVLITPHVSATTPRYWERELDLILANLGRYHAGQPLHNVVDPIVGY
ncbi:D-2-hydroxyacid dehydrogenase [soil metagenome]